MCEDKTVSTVDENKESIRELLPSECVVFTENEYDDAIVGISHDSRVIYSYDKLAEIIVNRDNCEYIDAYEWIDYNMIRAIPYQGEYAPIILESIMD